MTLTEDRLRAALGARADLVTQSDLRRLPLPTPASARTGWLMPLAAAAAVAAVLGGTAVVVDRQGAAAPMPANPSVVESADPSQTPVPSTLPTPVPSPATTQSTRPLATAKPVTSAPAKPGTPAPPKPVMSTPPQAATSTPPQPATSTPAKPVPSAPPKDVVKLVTIGRVTLEVPESWQADQGGGDTTCVGPKTAPCDGVLVAAAGEAVTDASDVGSVNCTAEPLTGPERVTLTNERAWYASFSCGWRQRWVLEADPFYSLAVIAAEPDGDQLRAIRSARLSPAKQ